MQGIERDTRGIEVRHKLDLEGTVRAVIAIFVLAIIVVAVVSSTANECDSSNSFHSIPR